jgi:hypothetical protein
MIMSNTPSHICGVFILSQDPASLAKFYREAIGLPLTYDHANETTPVKVSISSSHKLTKRPDSCRPHRLKPNPLRGGSAKAEATPTGGGHSPTKARGSGGRNPQIRVLLALEMPTDLVTLTGVIARMSKKSDKYPRH